MKSNVNFINKYLRQRRNYKKLSNIFKEKDDISIVMKGRNAGFFSIFFQVIGAIDFCYINGLNLIIDFDTGTYFDESYGRNWWRYYFDNYEFVFSNKLHLDSSVIDISSEKYFSYYGCSLSPHKASKYIKKLSVKREILEKAQKSLHKYDIEYVCGVHFRGTDKVSGGGKEAMRIPYDFILYNLKKLDKKYMFFIATDEQQFLDYAVDKLPGRVFFQDAIRSVDGNPIHSNARGCSMYRVGEEALLDCIILSKCNLLVRTDSNLSHACSFFSPGQKTINITKKFTRL